MISRLPSTAKLLRLTLALSVVIGLCQCSILDRVVNSSSVIYALGPQDSVPSPIGEASKLTATGPVITFSPARYLLTSRQVSAIEAQAEQWKEKPPQVLIMGFAKPGAPNGYARSLSQRRAESVRQVLIESGIDAAKLHSVGYGNDQPNLGSEDAVKMFVLP